MFVVEEDYKVVIGDTALKVLSQTDEINRERAEKQAVEEISGYLRPVYDVSEIFAKTGEDRNSLVVMFTCDIALYHMAASAPGRMGAEVRKERYDRAIAWLKDVQSGKVVPDLPMTTSPTGESGSPLRYGGEKPKNNVW